MAATAADIGFGIDLLKGNADGPPETFATFGVEITSLTPPGYSRDAVEATHMKSPDSFREYIQGLMQMGTVEIEGNFIANSSDVVIAALTAAAQSWQIEFPNGVTWTFEGFFTNYQPAAPIDDRQTFTASMQVTGKPVLA